MAANVVITGAGGVQLTIGQLKREWRVSGVGCEWVLGKLPADVTTCACRMHVRYEEVGGFGEVPCVGSTATFPAIKVLYAGAKQHNKYCHADEKTRGVDAVFERAMIDTGQSRVALLDGVLRRYRNNGSARSYSVAEFGGGYCFEHGVDPRYRVRAARILGPRPFVADYVCALTVVGWRDMGGVDVVETAPGLFHMELVTGRAVGLKGRALLAELLALVQKNPLARIGAGADEESGLQGYVNVRYPAGPAGVEGHVEGVGKKPWVVAGLDVLGPRYGYSVTVVRAVEQSERVRKLVELYEACGVLNSGAYPLDVALLCYAPAAMPSAFVGGSERVRVLAFIGDAALRLVGGLLVYGAAGKAVDCSVTARKFDNESLAAFASTGVFEGILDFAGVPINSKVRATYFEALVGGAVVYGGLSAVQKVLRRVRFPLNFPDDGAVVDPPVPSVLAVQLDAGDYVQFKRWQAAKREGAALD